MTGLCLRDLRRAAGLSQRALAARVPCAERTLQRWEARALLSPATRALLLDVFEGVAQERQMLRGALLRMRSA